MQLVPLPSGESSSNEKVLYQPIYLILLHLCNWLTASLGKHDVLYERGVYEQYVGGSGPLFLFLPAIPGGSCNLFFLPCRL